MDAEGRKTRSRRRPQVFDLLKVIRPERGEERINVLRPKSKVGTASLLLVGVLINPSERKAFFDQTIYGCRV